MPSINKVILVGYIGKAPEIRKMQNGDPVANFSVATSEQWTDKGSGQKREKTEWHRCVAFGGLAKVVEKYSGKGQRVYLEGKLQTRKWQDQSGADRYSTEVILTGYKAEFLMLSRSENANDPLDQRSDDQGPAQSYELDDDIPF